MNIKINKQKLDFTKILLIIFTLTLIACGFFTANKTKVAKVDTEGLALIETINTGVQRLSKLELENNHDLELIESLDSIADELISLNKELEYFSDSVEMQDIVKEFVMDLKAFEAAIDNYIENGDRMALFQASETNYADSTETVIQVTEFVKEETEYVNKLEIYMIINVVIMAALLVKILLDTLKELKHNKELSKDMFIDSSTGLYNRSKCQEILKNPRSAEDTKERAIIIFDLNDLKKTNDGLGHRAGDDLIASFAAQIKKATEVLNFEVFVGRYGGDEFMAYLDSCDEKDVQVYLEEVNYQLEFYNNTEGKPFKLSCAAGYCITTERTRSLTMREIFDTADENMYNNKIAMKAKKRQEMLEQGIEIEEIVDDRL